MRSLLVAVPVALACVAGACHQAPPPQVAAAPQVDSSADRARRDSIARAAEEARAREAAERLAEQQRADSLADAQRRSAEANAVLTAMIHFDFDKAAIRPEDARILDQKIPILQANTRLRVRVAGNCDERGSDEYNLALGNRRAITAKAYLVDHGIDAARIETVSYGKEKPVDPGHTQVAWAKDRNDQFENLTTNVVLR